MELGWGDVETGDLLVGDLDALLVGVLVQPAPDGEPGLRGGAGDQLDDDLMRQQRLAAPVLGGAGRKIPSGEAGCKASGGDEREQAILDAVPFAGSYAGEWVMAE